MTFVCCVAVGRSTTCIWDLKSISKDDPTHHDYAPLSSVALEILVPRKGILPPGGIMRVQHKLKL